MASSEFQRLREVFGELAVLHARRYALERFPPELRLAQRYYAAACDLPLQLPQRAGNQVTYDVFRDLLEDAVTMKEIADAMGWPAMELPPPAPRTDVRPSPSYTREPVASRLSMPPDNAKAVD